jgi:putrescine---pyruvate transaminase
LTIDKNVMDGSSHLILHRTSRAELEKGVTIISRGEGMRVFDKAGNSYVDMDAGVTRPVHLGYGRKDMAQAVYNQICELSYFTPAGFANEPAMALAEVLSQITPGDINRFTFECDGSEAVESAMKLAKHYHHHTGKKEAYKVISRRGAYHGVNGIGLRALGIVAPFRQMNEPVAPGAVFVESPYCYRCPFGLNYPACDIKCATDTERIIEFEGPDQISAFIAEPVQQGFGAYAPPPEYFPIIREICDRYNILLIIDEVICGFGRTGKWFGVEHFNIEADIITMAKGLTSGYVPLGGVGCTDRVMAPIDTFMHLHTYGNHPVSCAAALKCIDIMKTEELVENSARMGGYFLEGLKTLEKHPIVGETRGTGLWTAIDFTSDKSTRAPFPMDRLAAIVARVKARGFIIKLMGMALEFAPPLIVTKEDIDGLVTVLDEVIAEEVKDMGLS